MWTPWLNLKNENKSCLGAQFPKDSSRKQAREEIKTNMFTYGHCPYRIWRIEAVFSKTLGVCLGQIIL